MAPFRRQTMMSEMREMGIDPMGDIRSLGYEYRSGRLQKIGSDRGFEFTTSEGYSELAEAVSQYVPLLLEEEAKLNPLWLPLGVASGDGCPIFTSIGYEHAEKLLLIIQGAGRVLAGVWGCSLCINDHLDRGTMMPCIQKAADVGYGVIVFNPNQTCVDGKNVPGLDTFDRHVAYVMEKVVMARCAATEIDIIAHSHGGRSLMQYLGRSSSDKAASMLARKIGHIVFTDSYHSQGQLHFLPPLIRALLNDPNRCTNFVPHSHPLGTPVMEWHSQEYSFTAEDRGCACISTGVQDHASTNYAAMEAIFEFLGKHRMTQLSGGLCAASDFHVSRSLTGVQGLESVHVRLENNQISEDRTCEANLVFEMNPDTALPSNVMPAKKRIGRFSKISRRCSSEIKSLLTRATSRSNLVSPV